MSKCSSLLRLCANSPAPTSSTSESAACITTSPRCSTEALPVVREPLRSASAVCALTESHAEEHSGPERERQRKSLHEQRRGGMDGHIAGSRKGQLQQQLCSTIRNRQIG